MRQCSTYVLFASKSFTCIKRQACTMAFTGASGSFKKERRLGNVFSQSWCYLWLGIGGSSSTDWKSSLSCWRTMGLLTKVSKKGWLIQKAVFTTRRKTHGCSLTHLYKSYLTRRSCSNYWRENSLCDSRQIIWCQFSTRWKSDSLKISN